MADNQENHRLTDIIAFRHPHEPEPRPSPSPGTVMTFTLETIDDDRMMWFLGVLLPA